MSDGTYLMTDAELLELEAKAILNAERLREIAAERWSALQELDALHPLRKELAAVGVLPATIDALYPFSFADMVENLIPLLKKDSLAHLTSFEVIQPLRSRIAYLRKGEPFDLAAQMQAEVAVPAIHERVASLMRRISELLPKEELGQNTDPMARHLGILLWHSCKLMTMYEQWGDPETACELFLFATEALLPDFFAKSPYSDQWSLA